MLTGSIGMLPSAGSTPAARGCDEPIHARRPNRREGRGQSAATILSRHDAALFARAGNSRERIEAAVKKVLREGLRNR